MRDVCAAAVSAALDFGASYADARIVLSHSRQLTSRNGQLAQMDDEVTAGIGIRVLVGGAWGFASASGTTVDVASDTAWRATEVARASSLVQRRPVTLPAVTPVTGTWRTPVQTDPFSVGLAEIVEYLRSAEAGMRVDPRVRVSTATTTARRQNVWLVTSDGTDIEQEFTWTGAGLSAVATNGDDAQVRSFPNSFGGQTQGGGWEAVQNLNLLSRCDQVGWEAIELLSADECPRERTQLILDTTQLALQIHESIGHAAELDRVYGHEAAFAGGTYLGEDRLGTFQVGSEHVNISADATLDGALGTFGWDDEGVAAQRWMLVEQGRFTGYLDSRETAARLGNTHAAQGTSHGACRSAGYHRLPLVRMVNVSLEPGNAGTLEDLIRNTERGIYMETNSSWSIDDRRYNFQFGCERGYLIENGMRVKLLKNPSYAGISPQFWNSCDAVCDASEFRLWGLTNCGKGQPAQLMAMSHGSSPARFRDIEVGVSRRGGR